jgi:hypothetical protein
MAPSPWLRLNVSMPKPWHPKFHPCGVNPGWLMVGQSDTEMSMTTPSP